MIRRPPVSTRTDTLFPYTALFRSLSFGFDFLGQEAGFAIGFSVIPYAPADTYLRVRSEEHTSELQSLMRISYAVFCLKKKTTTHKNYIYKATHIHHTASYAINTYTNQYNTIHS